MILGLNTFQTFLSLLFLAGGLRNVLKPQTFPMQSPADLRFFLFLTFSEILFSAAFLVSLVLPSRGLWTLYVGCGAAALMVLAAHYQFVKKATHAIWAPISLSILSGLLVWVNVVVIR